MGATIPYLSADKNDMEIGKGIQPTDPGGFLTSPISVSVQTGFDSRSHLLQDPVELVTGQHFE